MTKSPLLAVALLFPVAALADTTDTGIHYDNVTIQYVNVDFDDIDPDADGVAFSISKLLGERAFISVGYAPSIETDEFTVSGFSGTLEERDLSVSLGGRSPIADNADLVASVGVLDATLEGTGDFAGSIDESDTGLTASAGVRAMATPSVELQGSLNYVDIFDETSTGFGVAANTYLSEQLALRLSYSSGDNSSSYSVGVRYSY